MGPRRLGDERGGVDDAQRPGLVAVHLDMRPDVSEEEIEPVRRNSTADVRQRVREERLEALPLYRKRRFPVRPEQVGELRDEPAGILEGERRELRTRAGHPRPPDDQLLNLVIVEYG